MRKRLWMPFNGMLQEFEMLCQEGGREGWREAGRKEGRDEDRNAGSEGGREEGGKEGVRAKEERTFAYLSRRCPLLSVIATDRSHCRSTLELVAGYTRVACSVFVFGAVDCFDRIGDW